jgi:hypothetical protein
MQNSKSTDNQTIKQSNKMVKTRNQAKEYKQSQQSKKSNDEEHMTMRSGLKIKKLERVELPCVKLSKDMKRRANVKKEIAKRSWKKQTDKKCNRFERLERDFLKHMYHNGGEMTAIWKNFETVFRDIDKLRLFQKCVEGNSIIIM